MMLRKLGNNKGESLAETLVSILIAALGILLLATMVQASSNVILKSEKAIKEFADKENKLIERDASAKKAGDYVAKISLGTEAIRFNKDESTADVGVECYQVEYGNTEVVAFGVK